VADDTVDDRVEEKAGRGLAAAGVVKPGPRLAVAFGGRGGAGNWSRVGDVEDGDDEDDKAKREEVDSKVAKDVDAGLPVPPRIYISWLSHKELDE
jgi:hypothetical protein